MGMEIAQMDLINIDAFAKRVAALAEYRQRLHDYIKVCLIFNFFSAILYLIFSESYG